DVMAKATPHSQSFSFVAYVGNFAGAVRSSVVESFNGQEKPVLNMKLSTIGQNRDGDFGAQNVEVAIWGKSSPAFVEMMENARRVFVGGVALKATSKDDYVNLSALGGDVSVVESFESAHGSAPAEANDDDSYFASLGATSEAPVASGAPADLDDEIPF
ncbi:MAG: hypothetical protein ACYDA1_06165, partial [Vulcanimicrobiaceae bacterium]